MSTLFFPFLFFVVFATSLQAIPTWEWVSPSEAVIFHNSPDGFESSINNDTYLFLCRAKTDGNRWIPGKLLLGAGEAKCWVGIHNTVESFNNFQMLTAEPGYTAWVRIPDREIPPEAIPAGEHRDGSTSYACRGTVFRSLLPGTYSPDDKQCYSVLDGHESISASNIEILVTTVLGGLLEQRYLENENQTDININ